jgi:gliding motility-associated-like protein
LNVNANGKYKVVVTLNGCTKSDSLNVNFTPIPTIALGRDTTICESTVYVLKSNSNADAFLWQNGATTANINVTQGGKYVLEARLRGCLKKDSVQITVNPMPKFKLGNDTTLCEGSPLLLSAMAQTGSTYLWQNNSTASTLAANANGKYKVVVTLNGCTKSDSLNVNFTPIPTIALGRDTTICESTVYVLKSNSNADAFLWQNGATTANINVTQGGKYVLQARLRGCLKKDSIQIAVTPLPRFDLGKDTVLCGGQFLNLSATVQNATFKWFDNSTGNTIKVTKNGSYTAEAVRLGCVFKDTIQVAFITPPQYSLGVDTTICADDVLILKANVANTTILWSDNSNQPTIRVTKEGIYWSDVATKEGCKTRDSIKIMVKICPKFQAFVPTAFSPNGDGFNEVIKPFFHPEFPIVGNYLFQIFNRWGDLVFSTTDKDQAWDGTCRNQSLQNDVFIYSVQATYKDLKGIEQKAKLSGDFTLVR